MYQGKPGFGGTAGYLSSNGVVDPSGYRAMPPLAHSAYHQPPYQDRYSPPLSVPPGHNHGQVPNPSRHPSPPHLNLTTGVSRGYEPARLTQPPLQPSPPLPHQRVAPGAHVLHATSHPAPGAKFNIYPSGNGQNTFIYEQSLNSKSDLFSEADTDATSIMTYSPTESTATVGGDTPLGSPLDAPSPGAPVSMERTASRTGAPTASQHQPRMGEYAPWVNPPGGIPQATALTKYGISSTLRAPSVLTPQNRTPSENSIDVRERIAVMNAKHNSASTGSYYSSSPPMSTAGSTSLQPPVSQYAIPGMGSLPTASSQAMFPDVFLQDSPEMHDRRMPPLEASPAPAGFKANGPIYPSPAIPIRERKSSVSYMAGPTPPPLYAQSTIPFASSSPPSRDRHDGRESSRRDDRQRERDRERDWDKENRAKYSSSSSSSPPELRSRTSSTSYGAGRPSDFPPVAPAMHAVAIYAKDENSSDRRPRHPDLTTPAAPPMRTRRMSFASQASEAPLTTAATSGTELPSAMTSSRHHSTPVSQSPPRNSMPRHPDLSRRNSDPEKMTHERERSERDRRRDRSPSRVPSSQPPRHPETQRRYSDGDQKLPLRITTSPSKGGSRSVRWNDNLICPSPITPLEKRTGWWNRRGDQLWTNDGVFKAALPGQQYPADLDDYPEAGEGWMNEDGVTIDIEHRRIPKLPRRPALKHVRTN